MADNSSNPQSTLHLDSIQLRLIAESASGLRGVPIHFVAFPDGTIREVWGHPGDLGMEPPPLEVVVVPAFTEDKVPEKPPLTLASIQAKGVEQPVDLLDLPGGLGPADAVFWSESAVEKFLLPYYASVYGNQAAVAVAAILEAFHGDSGVGGGTGAALDDTELTYALAHIPKSEYVMLSDASYSEETAAAGSDLVVLYEDGSGQARAERLPDFVRRRRERRAERQG
jgi:hypothetical protein